MPTVYILHLTTPLQHARHYSGCTHDLHNRLMEHANGSSKSRFTQILFEQGIDWSLGTAYQVDSDLANLRDIERILKDQHNAPRYCRICSGKKTLRLPYSLELPLADWPYPLDSRALRNDKPSATDGGECTD